MGYSADVYNTICKQRLIHGKGKRPKNWKQLNSGKYTHINCSHACSIYLQRKGCLKQGQIVGHTTRGKYKNKNTKAKAISGYRKLRNCDIVYVNTKFKKLPARYKKKGNVFIYDSDIAVYQGKGVIASCSSSGKRMTKSNVYHRTGYQFSHKILFVIVPH